MQQHPLFRIYTREWLSEATGFSKGYLSRLATGRDHVSRSFINQVCYKLGRPEEELFLPDPDEALPSGKSQRQQKPV